MRGDLYLRPQNAAPLTSAEKTDLLRRYFESYSQLAESDASELNVKIPRETFGELLHEIGALLVQRGQEMANERGPVREFLDAHPLPDSLKGLLPDEFRAFCIALNALKQWVAAEQSATDRYLLGGRARAYCLQAAECCLVTGNSVVREDVELHHPLRDGRPPIPLSKEGHDLIEGQTKGFEYEDWMSLSIRRIRSEGNRSWRSLRRGCLRALGVSIPESTPAVAAGDRSFSRLVVLETGSRYDAILEWLDSRGLGHLPNTN